MFVCGGVWGRWVCVCVCVFRGGFLGLCGEEICADTVGAGSSRWPSNSTEFGHSENGGRTFLRNLGTIGTSLHGSTARNNRHFTARCHCPEHCRSSKVRTAISRVLDTSSMYIVIYYYIMCPQYWETALMKRDGAISQ